MALQKLGLLASTLALVAGCTVNIAPNAFPGMPSGSAAPVPPASAAPAAQPPAAQPPAAQPPATPPSAALPPAAQPPAAQPPAEPPRPTPTPKPTPAPTDARRPTEADVTAWIKDYEAGRMSGGMTHESVKVTVHAIAIGEPRKANAQDLVDGAKAELMYPVEAKWTAVQTRPNEEPRTIETHYAWDFYLDQFGKWNAIGKGPVS